MKELFDEKDIQKQKIQIWLTDFGCHQIYSSQIYKTKKSVNAGSVYSEENKYLDLLYFIIWLYIVGVGLQTFRLNSDILKA